MVLKNKFTQPIGITFIGCFKIISALVLLITLNIDQIPPFNIRFGVPFIPETIVKLMLIIFTLIASYGYLRQTRWGFLSIVIYSIVFSITSMMLFLTYKTSPFLWNACYSFVVAIYSIFQKNKFTN